VTQPEPGRFLITTRAGARYRTRPARILEPLPDPQPATRPRPLPTHEQHHGDGTDQTDHPDDLDWRRRLIPRARGTSNHPRPTARTNGVMESLRRARHEPRTPDSTPSPPPDPDPPPF
jgi:hypothetical protein